MPKIIICEADSLIMTDLREITLSMRGYTGSICCMSFDDAMRTVATIDRLSAFLVREHAKRVRASGITEMVQERGGKVIWLGGKFDDIPDSWSCVPWPFTSESVLAELNLAVASVDPAGTGSVPSSSSLGAESLCR